jgi:hypothetical protein
MRLLRLHTLLVLVLALALVGVGAGFKGCNPPPGNTNGNSNSANNTTQINIVIASMAAAEGLVPTWNLPAQQQQCAEAGLRAAHDGFVSFRNGAVGWDAVVAAFENFRAGDCVKDARLAAILNAAEQIVQDLRAPRGARAVAVTPQVFERRVRPEHVAELQRLTQH